MESVINKHELGRKIKLARESFGYTQFQLSCLIGISPNFLGDIERGIKLPSLETLIRICNTLKLSMDYLFSDSLNSLVEEEENIIYTDKQMKVINNIIKSVRSNF